ncbi:MAG: MBL fold metallo-hydrolase [Thiobacillaceae bacterium]|nr:MBL fold metallo-hydrolase [Thiobacillaceae bacterium]
MHRLMSAFLSLALVLAGTRVHAADYPPVDVPVRAVQIGPHSYYVPGLAGAASADNQGFMSNAGFVITPAGVVVFDALGTPSLAQAMLAEIRKLTQAPIRRVLVSHFHADHYYGLQVFKDAGAEIWAHVNAQGATRSLAARLRFEQRKEVLQPWVSDELQRFIEADVWLEGDVDFELGGVRFLVRHVGPAHSPEDLALFVADDGVLYAGDLVFKGRVPFVGEADSRLWLASLEKLLALAPRVLVPGHGQASLEPAQDLGLTRDYLRYLREQMGRAVADLVPFEEAYRNTDWSRYEHLPAFAEANRVNAYNTYILMERESLGP